MTKLIVFAISHYCEKARWALDWHGHPYGEINWPPGPHLLLAKRLGAAKSSVPILQLDNAEIVQGSDQIITWADQNSNRRTIGLTTCESSQLETRADKVLGVNIRRLVYGECLRNYPEVVKPVLFHNLSRSQLLAANLMWPLTWRAMTKAYKLTQQAPTESRVAVEAELDWLDQLIADGRPFLTGERFTRADIAVASLLSPVAQPDAMPLYQGMSLPEPLAADIVRWRSRPIVEWANRIYQEHRVPA